MSDSSATYCTLTERLSGDVSAESSCGKEVFTSGHASLDACLKGGFQRGQLHEVFAAQTEDNGSASGFAAMLALCAAQPGKNMLWLRTLSTIRKAGRFHPSGFAELGGDPSTLLMAVAPNDTALLRCAVDALRCDSFSVVVIECWGSPAILDLTASRRLTLAADRSGVTPLMLRLNAREQPSTASTRWSVRAAPAAPLEANAPGLPTLDITLKRQRAGPSGQSWLVEWDRDQQTFRKAAHLDEQNGEPAQAGPAALSGSVVPIPLIGQVAARKTLRLSA